MVKENLNFHIKYKRPENVVNSGLVSYYKGNSLEDKKDRSDGVLRSSSNIGFTNPITFETGKIKKAWKFNGQQTYLDYLAGSSYIAFGKTSCATIAQSFVAQPQKVLTGFWFTTNKTSGTPMAGTYLDMNIYDDNGGSPGTNILYTKDISALVTNGLYLGVDVWINIDSGAINLVAGTTYWVTINSRLILSDSTVALWTVRYNSAGTYGVMKKKTSAGVWSVVTGTMAFKFVYSDDITVSPDISLPYSTFSIALWIKPTTTDYMSLINKTRDSSSGHLEINKTTVNTLRIENYSNTYVKEDIALGKTLLNNWTHLVVVNDATSLRVYVDNALVSTQTKLTDTVPQLFRVFGCDNYSPNSTYGRSYSGYMEDIRFYNRAITTAEINSIYTFPNNQSGFIQEGEVNDGENEDKTFTSENINFKKISRRI
jgi:hypothetical protein